MKIVLYKILGFPRWWKNIKNQKGQNELLHSDGRFSESIMVSVKNRTGYNN